MFSATYHMLNFYLYWVPEKNLISLRKLFKVCIEFFETKIKTLPKVEQPLEKIHEESNKSETHRSKISDCPSVPNEHSRSESFQEVNIGEINFSYVPPIPLEGLMSPSVAGEPTPPKNILGLAVGAFSTVSGSSSTMINNNCRKELETILESVQKNSYTNISCPFNTKILKVVVAITIIVTHILYAIVYYFVCDYFRKFLGVGIAVYITLYDLLVFCWGNSVYHSKFVSKKTISLLLLFGRVMISLNPEYFDLTHTINQLVMGVLVCLSLRDYYFPLHPRTNPVVQPVGVFKVLYRFEVQFILVIIGILPFSLIPFFRYSGVVHTLQLCFIIPSIIGLIVFFCHTIWDRLYQKAQYKLNRTLIFFALGIWVVWIGLFFIGIYILPCFGYKDYLFTALFFHPSFLLITVMLRHWIINDYNFYEVPPLDIPDISLSSTRQPFQTTPEAQRSFHEEGPEEQKLGVLSKVIELLKSYIPTTPTNTKMCICMFLFKILGLSIHVLFRYSCFSTFFYSLICGIYTIFYLSITTVGYIKKLYTFTFTNIMLLFFGIFLTISWSLEVINKYDDDWTNQELNYIILRSFCTFVVSFLCIAILICNFIDNDFEITKTSITCFGIMSLFLESWGLNEYFRSKLIVFIVLSNSIISAVLLILIYHCQWKSNNYRAPQILSHGFLFLFSIGVCVIAYYTVINEKLINAWHFICFSLSFALCILIVKYIHYHQKWKKDNYHREVASPYFFPLYSYNSESMKMTSWNYLCHLVFRGIKFILCSSLIIDGISNENYDCNCITISCLFINFFWLYTLDKIALTRVIELKHFARLDSKDLLICLSRSLSSIQSTVEDHLNCPDMKEIITSVQALSKIEPWIQLKDAILQEIGGIRSLWNKPNISGLKNHPDPRIDEIAKRFRLINPELPPDQELSPLGKMEEFHKVDNILRELLDIKNKYMAAFLTHIELESKIKSSPRHLIRNRGRDSLRIFEEDKREVDILLKIGEMDPDSQLCNFQSTGFMDKEFNYCSFSKPCVWVRANCIYPKNYQTVVFHDHPVGDIQQGELDDCWVIAAISLLSEDGPEYIRSIFEDVKEDAVVEGKYSLKLFSEGKRITINVDDYFPCTVDSGEAMCCQPLLDPILEKKAIWPMLLEKAIAKEYEGYHNLEGGAIDYAMMIMTGNPAFRYNLLNEATQLLIADGSLWKKMLRFSDRNFMMGAGTLPKGEMPLFSEGLKESHAYAILDAFEFDNNKLIKLKNPWGDSSWTGAWSSLSSNWTNRMKQYVLERKDKKRLRMLRREEGKACAIGDSPSQFPFYRRSTFFISWEDFVRAFEVIFVSITFDEKWGLVQILDCWEFGRAGGSSNHIETVKDNPQYLLDFAIPTQVFCLLTQHISPSNPNIPKIGFCIFKYENKVIGENEIIPEMVAIGRYSQERAISLNTQMPAGKYALLLSTLEPGEYGKFTFNLWFSKSEAVLGRPEVIISKLK